VTISHITAERASLLRVKKVEQHWAEIGSVVLLLASLSLWPDFLRNRRLQDFLLLSALYNFAYSSVKVWQNRLERLTLISFFLDSLVFGSKSLLVSQ